MAPPQAAQLQQDQHAADQEQQGNDRETTCSASAYYAHWSGVRPDLLRLTLAAIRFDPEGAAERPLVLLAGDSSLDNKYWVPSDRATAVNGYERFLRPPSSREDVCHWLNAALAERHGGRVACVNGAVEASTLAQRGDGRTLLPQDEAVRDALRPCDALVVSVGGNDIALAPSAKTALCMLALMHCTSVAALRQGKSCFYAHFVQLFRDKVERYVAALTAKTKPRCVVICMIYYPCESAGQESWAAPMFRALGYDASPQRLQAAIHAMCEHATREVALEGTEVLALPLFNVLDAKDPNDYVARVEPSSQGGRKIAGAILDLVMPLLLEPRSQAAGRAPPLAPLTQV